MITCQHAKHLFDRYLDGELPPSLQTELHAHQLSCSDCQSELALLESCGDVIAYDRSEPALSTSFTDRVLLAHRARMPVAPARHWSRLIIRIASPVAAAACIAMAVLLIAPAGDEPRQSKVLGARERVSDSLEHILKGDSASTADSRSPSVREMPAGFVDVVLDPYVKQTRSTLDSTKRTFEQLESLLGLGFAGANNALAAGWRNMESDRTKAGAAPSPKVSGPDLFVPSLPYEPSPGADPSNSSDLDDTIEAL